MSTAEQITVDSIFGRTLLALRAGKMSGAELLERVGCYPQTSSLERMGYVTRIDDEWQITEKGRAACPLRNPLAAVVQKPRGVAPLSRSIAAIGLPNRTAAQRPINQPVTPENKGGIRMPNTASTLKPTAVDLVRRALIASPKGVARKDLIKNTGLKPAGVDNAIANLIKSGEAERKGYGIVAAIPPGINVMAGRLALSDAIAAASTPTAAGTPELIDPRGKGRAEAAHRAEAASETPSPIIMQPLSVTVRDVATDTSSPEVDFSIYSDGRLAIIDGDEILVLPPDATKRLGYFLGCLERNTWPPRFDPVALQPQSLAT